MKLLEPHESIDSYLETLQETWEASWQMNCDRTRTILQDILIGTRSNLELMRGVAQDEPALIRNIQNSIRRTLRVKFTRNKNFHDK